MQSSKLAGVTALFCAGLLLAQTPEPSKPSSSNAQKPPEMDSKQAPPSAPIRVNVNEVIVPVSVTDDKGKFVSDLDQKDFQIFEDNKPQHIQFFTR